jgi:hypothetical protein
MMAVFLGGGTRPEEDTCRASGADITYPDVKALMAGCLARDADDPHGTALSRLISVVADGLRTRPG